jgi:hypothetical protein
MDMFKIKNRLIFQLKDGLQEEGTRRRKKCCHTIEARDLDPVEHRTPHDLGQTQYQAPRC